MDGCADSAVLVQGILGRVLDHNKHVQEAACSGLATLEEVAGSELQPCLQVWPGIYLDFVISKRPSNPSFSVGRSKPTISYKSP